MNKQIRIAGVVIVYNPADDVIGNIKSYCSQVEHLYVFDNSDIINDRVKEFASTLPNSEYVNQGCNTGIATVLNVSAEKALDAGFDYLLTMDQDSVAEYDMVEKLLLARDYFSNIGVITPQHLSKAHPLPMVTGSFEEVVNTMTSGNLLDLTVFRVMNGFCEDYFIDWVDIDYYWRLKLNGYKVIKANTAILHHNEGDIQKIRFFHRYIHTLNCNSTRVYYKTRNYLMLRCKFKKTLGDQVREMDLFCALYFFKILFFETEKCAKIRMVLKGWLDYRKKKVGKYCV